MIRVVIGLIAFGALLDFLTSTEDVLAVTSVVLGAFAVLMGLCVKPDPARKERSCEVAS